MVRCIICGQNDCGDAGAAASLYPPISLTRKVTDMADPQEQVERRVFLDIDGKEVDERDPRVQTMHVVSEPVTIRVGGSDLPEPTPHDELHDPAYAAAPPVGGVPTPDEGSSSKTRTADEVAAAGVERDANRTGEARGTGSTGFGQPRADAGSSNVPPLGGDISGQSPLSRGKR